MTTGVYGLIRTLQMYILMYVRGASMKTAKVFKSGNSQAVRIPKEFHLEDDEVEIRRKGDSLILRPKKRSWATLFESLDKFTDDFMAEGRNQPPVQKRRRTF
jgi:antitoxin VapB